MTSGRVRLLAIVLALLSVVTVPSGWASAKPGATDSVPTKSSLASADPAPSAVWTSNGGRLDVFQVSSRQLKQKTWTPGNGWTGLLTVPVREPDSGFGSFPSATWTADGTRLDVFVRGGNGHLYQTFWNGSSGWSSWQHLGGVLISAPSAAWTSNGARLDLFGIGTNGLPHQKSWTRTGGWTGWKAFPAPPGGVGSGGSPSITWTADGTRLDIFIISSNGRLYQMSWTPAGWSDWFDLAGDLVQSPSAAWTNNGARLDVFSNTLEGKLLQQRSWTRTGGWSTTYISLPSGGWSSSPSITWTADGSRLDVLHADIDNEALYQMFWTGGGGWSNWKFLG